MLFDSGSVNRNVGDVVIRPVGTVRANASEVVSVTARTVDTCPALNFEVIFWRAVIVVSPAVMTVTTSPAIVATSVSELVYVQAPSLFDVGGVNVKVRGVVATVGIDHTGTRF